jgi:hypothetical protein
VIDGKLVKGAQTMAVLNPATEECDLAALVYDEHQDRDAVLRDFASDLKAQGLRAVGMVQAGQCADSSLSAVLVHNGEKLLLAQGFDPSRAAAGSTSGGSRTRPPGSPMRSRPAPTS